MEHNKYVHKAQENLINAGYSVGGAGADGKFGADTLNAVNNVIADAKKSSDAKDDAPEGKLQYAFTQDMEYKDEGEGIQNLQRLLIKWHMGYYLGEAGADGIFGRGTKEAVTEFQKGMSQKITGTVNEKLWEMLNTEPVDISKWTMPDSTGRLPLSCNCMGKYCDSQKNGKAGITSVGLMILLVRIEKEMNRRFNRDDIVIHLTDDMNLHDIDDRNGGNRCQRWNRLHGGAAGSQHTKWRAADIYFDCLVDDNCPDMEDLYAVADELNPYGGVGEYRYNIHVDTRGSWARW
jgi:peptidoglycan hydrolase-like protein with peptidoglycan-binding domain